MALLPMVDNRFVLIWTRHPPKPNAWPPCRARLLDALQDCFGYRMGRFRRSASATVTAGMAGSEQVRAQGLGNAAHSLHPIAGQGYNLSLRDAIALAGTLLASSAPLGDLATLQGYVASQQRDQDLTIGFSDQVTRLFSNHTPGLSQGRRLGLLGLELCPPAKNLFARQAMGLGSRPVTSRSFT